MYDQIQNPFVSTGGQWITVTTNCHTAGGMQIAKSLKSLNLNFKVILFILAGASNIFTEFKFSNLNDWLIRVDYMVSGGLHPRT